MSGAELNKIKSELVDWVNSLTDAGVIKRLQKMKRSASEKEDWDDLPEPFKNKILKGIKDAKEGKSIPSEEMWKRIKNV